MQLIDYIKLQNVYEVKTVAT